MLLLFKDLLKWIFSTETLALLALIIQPLSILYAHQLGRKATKEDKIKEIAKERYQKFYCPYINLLNQCYLFMPSVIDLANHNLAIRFEKLIDENIQYIDAKTLKLYQIFIRINFNLMEYEDGNKEYKTAPTEWKAIFSLLTQTVLEESRLLSTEIGYPDITSTFEKVYLQSDNTMKYYIVLKDYLI